MRAADPKLKTVRNKFIFFSLLFIILSKIGGIVRMIGYTISPSFVKKGHCVFAVVFLHIGWIFVCISILEK